MSVYVGTNSESICEYRDFFHVRSIFNDEWYNLVVPKLSNPHNLDQNQIKELINRENDQGKKVSFYINHEILSAYHDFLDQNLYTLFGDDIYLQKALDSEKKINIPNEYTFSDSYRLEELIGVLEKCFPDWPEERLYSTIYEKYKTAGQEDRLFETVVINFNNEIIGGASMTIDRSLGLGYLHNDGVLESHRRKGLHTALIDYRCNFCLNNGIKKVVAIVDEHAGSYPSFLKNGFTIADKFFVFVKKSTG